MKKLRISCIIVMMILTITVTAQDDKQRLDPAFAAVEPKVIEWRRDIHQHPELSNREFRAAKKVADHLRVLGLDEVRTGIALRADMDALPVREQTGLPLMLCPV